MSAFKMRILKNSKKYNPSAQKSKLLSIVLSFWMGGRIFSNTLPTSRVELSVKIG